MNQLRHFIKIERDTKSKKYMSDAGMLEEYDRPKHNGRQKETYRPPIAPRESRRYLRSEGVGVVPVHNNKYYVTNGGKTKTLDAQQLTTLGRNKYDKEYKENK